ncbi:hypothetical protein BDM02DRAFT_3132547 [Thelephora ganbajun]|uniref:Uncharacterized protein n=1 Tax=Thelephora ganbajun TaxID=370292 RepID=A0ACB6Z299_THEGA|nr:hypothetical protein BDM02DRAFT_3132547 [Thelephora ganbajun]
MEGIKEYNGPIEVSMGYTSSVGTMLAKEIALTNDLVRAISTNTRALEERVGVLTTSLEGMERDLHCLKRSHEALKIHTELELSVRDLTIGVLHARINHLLLMEINLMNKEEVMSPPTGNTSMMDVLVEVRVETPKVVLEWDQGEALVRMEVLVSTLILIEDEEVPKPMGIQLPHNTFNWQDEAAQGWEEYYHHQREEEERACEELEFIPPPDYGELFPDMVRADRARYTA